MAKNNLGISEENQLDDILNNISELEQERAPYNRVAREWMSMWQLKAFDKTAQQTMADSGHEQVVTSQPYNVVMLAKRLIASHPSIEVPSGAAQDDDDRAAAIRERWLMAFWQRINREQRRNVLSDATWHSLVRGRYCFEVKWVKDALPKRLKESRLPVLVRTLDPLNVGVKAGPLWSLYGYHKYRQQRQLARQRYGDLVKPSSGDWRSNQEDIVEIVDYWWHDPVDGSVWNAVLVDNDYVIKPTLTKYPDIPFIEGFGDSAPIAGEEWKGMSILQPLKQSWPYSCRLASQVATGLLYHFWPAILIENENGVQLPDISIQPGTTTTMPAGVHVNMLRGDVNLPLAEQMMKIIENDAQMATFPGVLYGQAPGDIQAGYAVSLLSDQARGRVNQFRENLETGIETVNALALGLVEAYAGSKGVTLWGKNTGDGKIFKETLKPEDINGIYENVVTLIPNLPSDQAQRLTLWMRLVETGIVSKRTMRDKAIDEELPSDEQARIDIERAFESDPMKMKTALRALQSYFPDTWMQIVRATDFEKLAMAEYGQPGTPGSTPEAAGPAALPPLLPGAATPPGGPMAPQGGMPQGIPTSVDQIPPEILQQLPPGVTPEMFLQMLQQQMAGGGGAPGGTMPQGMPPQGGEMPQGMPQGGPLMPMQAPQGAGPGAPMQQAPGMPMPNEMQPMGLPPGIGPNSEGVGQVTNEMLGISPEDAGLGLYQQLTGKNFTNKQEGDQLAGLPPEMTSRGSKGRKR